MEFFVFGLATWRVASLLVHEEGPWKVFFRLRVWAGIVHGPQGEIAMIPDRFLAGVLSCVWCCSLWVALGWSAFWLVSPVGSVWCAGVFAMSAAAIGMEKVIRDE